MMNKFSAIVLLISLSGLSFSGRAAEKILLTGVETISDSSSYVYVGTVIPLPDNTLAHGLAIHLWADFLKYAYDSGATEINAKANSVSAAIAYHDSGSNYWWNAKIGMTQNDTRLTPDDLSNQSRGKQSALKLQLGGEHRFSSTIKVTGIADYVPDREAYWTRLRLLGKIDGQKYHGPEIIFQGDPSYDAQQLGWVITGIAIQEHSLLGAKAGVRKGGDSTSGYIGVELLTFY